MNSCPLSLWPRPWQLFGPSFFPPPFSAGDWRTYTRRFGWRLFHAFPSMLSSYDAVDAGWMRMKTKGAEYILQLRYAQMAKLLLILLLKLFLWWTSPRISSEGHLLLFPRLAEVWSWKNCGSHHLTSLTSSPSACQAAALDGCCGTDKIIHVDYIPNTATPLLSFQITLCLISLFLRLIQLSLLPLSVACNIHKDAQLPLLSILMSSLCHEVFP